jgi:hypothetical protein
MDENRPADVQRAFWRAMRPYAKNNRHGLRMRKIRFDQSRTGFARLPVKRLVRQNMRPRYKILSARPLQPLTVAASSADAA